MRTTRLIFSLALPCLLIAGCPGEDSTVPDAGTDLPQNLLMGEICVEDGQCVSDYCLKYTGDTEGYCTTTDCVDDEDCISQCVVEPCNMCCVEVDAAYFICLKIADGYTCSSPVGDCGISCADDPDICPLSNPCLGEGDLAMCSQQCTTNADCAGCDPRGLPDGNMECVTQESGEKWCMLVPEQPCVSTADCPEGETCTIGVNADSTELFGECATYGALPPGSDCNDTDDPADLEFEERCSGLYCFGGGCSEVCTVDDDCPEGMSCLEHTFEDIADSIKVCQGVQ